MIVALAAVLLLLIGIALDVPIAIILSIVVLLTESVSEVWRRFGLRDVAYRRRLDRHRLVWGDETAATIEVWNRKRLPLAWLRADDAATPGVVVRERELVQERVGAPVLRNAWTLAPFERVSRRFHIGAEFRGVYELGPVELSVGDLLARRAAVEERPGIDRFLVWPRTVPTDDLRRRDTVGGADRARSGLSEDPSRFAGVRDFAPGDQLRRVHPRASARLGHPMVKRFEPSRDREVLLALDVQATAGRIWEALTDVDEVEALIVVTASLIRTLTRERAAIGLAAAGYHGAESRLAFLPVSAGPGQAERAFDLLARLSTEPSAPFEQLIGMLMRAVRPGTTVVVVTGRDPAPYLAHLRRLERAGYPVVVLGCGPRSELAAGRARAAGLTARVALLDGPWRAATRVALS